MTFTKEAVVENLTTRMIGSLVDQALEVGYLRLFCRQSDNGEALYTRVWNDGTETLNVKVEQDFVAFTFTHHNVLEQSFSVVCELDMHFRVIATNITMTSGDLNKVVSRFHELMTKVVGAFDTEGNPRRTAKLS